MLHTIEFPLYGPLPDNPRQPPYVLFGINGEDVSSSLPPHIPLRIVLHFAPKLKEYLLPPPTQLPRHAIHLNLLTPFVGINIQDDLDLQGLEWIISKMMQISGVVPRKVPFFVSPSLLTSISIRRAWLAIGLPIAGLDGLHYHIQMHMTMIPAITLAELQAVWHTFPLDSIFTRLAAINFIKSDIDFLYDSKDVVRVRYWLSISMDRYRFFKSIEEQFQQPSKCVLAGVRRAYADEITEVEISETHDEDTAVVAGKGRVVNKKEPCQRVKSNVGVTSVKTGKLTYQAQKNKDEQIAMTARLTEALVKLKLERDAEEERQGEN